MCRLQINGAGLACVHRSQPCSGADTPRVSCFQSWEVELWGRRHQIIALLPCKTEKCVVDHTAHGVRPVIVVIGVAASIPVPAGQGIRGARGEFGAEDIDARVHDVA